MPNKIQEELKKIAQEIIATKGSVDFEKTYYQTLSLFEKLVVLKNAEVAKKETWKDMESNYNKAIDFIELKKEPVKVLGQNREEIPRENQRKFARKSARKLEYPRENHDFTIFIAPRES